MAVDYPPPRYQHSRNVSLLTAGLADSVPAVLGIWMAEASPARQFDLAALVALGLNKVMLGEGNLGKVTGEAGVNLGETCGV